MAENLKTTKYRNGDLIGTTNLDISIETSPKYQWANENNESNVSTYGRIYQNGVRNCSIYDRTVNKMKHTNGYRYCLFVTLT